MASLVDIYNMALVDLAADLIADPDNLTGNALVLSTRWPGVRDAVMRSHGWNCLMRRVLLPPMTAAPAFGYRTQYLLPADCLRPMDIGDPKAEWKVEGRNILANSSGSIRLRYVARIEEPEAYDPLLVQAMVCRLAAVCAWRVAKKARADELWGMYEKALDEAKRADVLEGWPERIQFESTILTDEEEGCLDG